MNVEAHGPAEHQFYVNSSLMSHAGHHKGATGSFYTSALHRKYQAVTKSSVVQSRAQASC